MGVAPKGRMVKSLSVKNSQWITQNRRIELALSNLSGNQLSSQSRLTLVITLDRSESGRFPLFYGRPIERRFIEDFEKEIDLAFTTFSDYCSKVAHQKFL